MIGETGPFYGSCEFCGQSIQLESVPDSLEAGDAMATGLCACSAAHERRRAIERRTTQISLAGERIISYFRTPEEEGFTPMPARSAESIIELLCSALESIADGHISKITISCDGTTGSVKLGSKGQLTVERKDTRSGKAEC